LQRNHVGSLRQPARFSDITSSGMVKRASGISE
jgi:hypothetical protein